MKRTLHILSFALFSILNYRDFVIGSTKVAKECLEGSDTCEEGEEIKKVSRINDPLKHLKPIKINIDGKEEEFLAYKTPDIASFYKDNRTNRNKIIKSQANGFGVKFVNLSDEEVFWYWHPGPGKEGMLMGNAQPFHSYGTSSFPGHEFYFARARYEDEQEEDEEEIILKWFEIEEGTGIYYYDPFEEEEEELQKSNEEFNLEDYLEEKELELYKLQKNNLKFCEQYKNFTGRDWYSLYPLRKNMFHTMWDADYLSQEHWVLTKETHFEKVVPEEELKKAKEYIITTRNNDKDDDSRVLSTYRSKDAYLNMTLKVLSVAPRVFEIENFLSEVEVNHILDLATTLNLERSTTGDGDEQDVRTSTNTWVERETTVVTDAIYRRTADLLLMDEMLLRDRNINEFPQLSSTTTAAEALQLVHYLPGQEYTAHHDAGNPDITLKLQNDRFATVLLYLNEGMTGGYTSFPKWINGHTSQALKVQPKKGKAVLFYSYLPDGNMDEFSQHAAMPVTEGEKWLMNLWVWDPVRD